jgi:hypothetical protein
MFNILKKWGVLTFCLALLIGLPIQSVTARDSFKVEFGRLVAGSYLIENLAIPDAGLAGMQALATISIDGTVVATDTDDYGLAATAPQSPKHGAWKRTGRRQISITVLEFAYDAAGIHNFTWRLEFTGEFTNQRFKRGSGTQVAKLFPVPYPPGMDPLDPNAPPIFQANGSFDFRRIMP